MQLLAGTSQTVRVDRFPPSSRFLKRSRFDSDTEKLESDRHHLLGIYHQEGQCAPLGLCDYCEKILTSKTTEGVVSTPSQNSGQGLEGQRLRPVLSLGALVLFGLAFVGPTAPYTFFGVGAVESRGHFALVYLIAMIAVSFTALSYGKMATAFPEAGSAYAYASKAIHPVIGYFAGWVMILDYILMPMLCVIIAGPTSHKLVPAIPYSIWVVGTAAVITGVNLAGIEMTSRATIIFNVVLAVSVVWFVGAAVWALTHALGHATLFSIEPFYSPQSFSLRAVMSATPVAVLSFLGFDGISTLAEDAKEPEKNVARATVLVCVIAGVLFILQTYLGQLIWPDYSTFSPIETAFSDIGRLIGGPGLAYLIALLVVAQAWASGITVRRAPRVCCSEWLGTANCRAWSSDIFILIAGHPSTASC